MDADRSALVVIGGSTGIGREFARLAPRDMRDIVLVGRSPGTLEESAGILREQNRTAYPLVLDATARGASESVREFLSDHHLTCGVLVNSAGRALLGPATLLPVREQLDIIDLNARALAAMTLEFLPDMTAHRRGGVINIGSLAGFVPGPNMAVYYATKAFVRSFSEALHEEVRGHGVTVTCVAPGPVNTGFLGLAGAERARLYRTLPRLSASSVARAGWAAFSKRRRLVVPGVSHYVASVLAAAAPHAVSLPFLARQQRRRAE